MAARRLNASGHSVYSMQMSEIRTVSMEQTLTRLCKASDVPDEGVRQVYLPVQGVEIAVYKLSGAFYATDDLCTHGLASLAEGDVEGFEIICPLHGGAFDIRTGKATQAPCRLPLKTYKVVVIGDELHADLG